MWYLPDDDTRPVLTADDHIRSAHRECNLRLPKTAVLYYMGGCAEYLRARYGARELPEPLPRFLYRCPVWETEDGQVCFLDGGRGAPQAADTVETLAALGVERILSVGLFGAFSDRVRVGEIIAPEKAFIEEGTSLHYADQPAYSRPDAVMLHRVAFALGLRTCPLITTDAVYRQTFRKERLWREMGAVGVDMETSAVFTVAKCRGVRAVALLMASDQHPLSPDAPRWAWHMTEDRREAMAEQSLRLARLLAEE